MKQEGLPYGSRTMTYNSRLAQELAAWAVEQPGGEKIHDLLFRAYFVEGKNIGQQDVLLPIAEKAGLSGSRASEILHQSSMQETVDHDWQQSRQLGITGVPTFFVDRQTLVGAQPYEAIQQLVENAGAKQRKN